MDILDRDREWVYKDRDVLDTRHVSTGGYHYLSMDIYIHR